MTTLTLFSHCKSEVTRVSTGLGSSITGRVTKISKLLSIILLYLTKLVKES